MADFDAADALDMAMEVEKNGEVFYTAAAQKATDPKIKVALQALAAQEQGHYEVFWKMAGGLGSPDPQLLGSRRWSMKARLVTAS